MEGRRRATGASSSTTTACTGWTRSDPPQVERQAEAPEGLRLDGAGPGRRRGAGAVDGTLWWRGDGRAARRSAMFVAAAACARARRPRARRRRAAPPARRARGERRARRPGEARSRVTRRCSLLAARRRRRRRTRCSRTRRPSAARRSTRAPREVVVPLQRAGRGRVRRGPRLRRRRERVDDGAVTRARAATRRVGVGLKPRPARRHVRRDLPRRLRRLAPGHAAASSSRSASGGARGGAGGRRPRRRRAPGR